MKEFSNTMQTNKIRSFKYKSKDVGKQSKLVE